MGSVSEFWKLYEEPSPSDTNTRVSNMCAALFIINVYEFFWVNISCTQRRRHSPKWKYICEKRTLETKEELSKRNENKCPNRRSILISTSCLNFERTGYPVRPDQGLRISSQKILNKNAMFALKQLEKSDYFHIMLSKFFQESTILTAENEDDHQQLSQTLALLKSQELFHLDIQKWKVIDLSVFHMKKQNTTPLILRISRSMKEDHKCHPGGYQCRNSFCIALKYVCDNITHCDDEEDEENATCSNIWLLIAFSQSIAANLSNVNLDVHQDVFLSHNRNVPYASCHLVSMNRVGTANGDSEYPFHKVCVFDRLDVHCSGTFMAANLLFCKSHVCLREFKCPESYCVPFRTICDGFHDCPHGEDQFD